MKHKTGSLVLASCVALLALAGPAISAAPPETPPARRAPAMNPDEMRRLAEQAIRNFDGEVDAALKKIQRLIKEELNKRDREARSARVNADAALGQAKSAIAAAKTCDSDFFRRHSEWARERIQSAREHRENVHRITRDLDEQAQQTMKEMEESATRTSALIRSGFTDLRALGLTKNSREWQLLQKTFADWVDKRAMQEMRGTPKNKFNDPGGWFQLKEAHSRLYGWLRKDEQSSAVNLPQAEEAIEKAIKEGESLLKKNCPPKVAAPKTTLEGKTSPPRQMAKETPPKVGPPKTRVAAVPNEGIFLFATIGGDGPDKIRYRYSCSMSFRWSFTLAGTRQYQLFDSKVFEFDTLYDERTKSNEKRIDLVGTKSENLQIEDVPSISCKVTQVAESRSEKIEYPKAGLPYDPPKPDFKVDPKSRK